MVKNQKSIHMFAWKADGVQQCMGAARDNFRDRKGHDPLKR